MRSLTEATLLAALGAAAPQALAIDPSHSIAAFRVSHIWVDHVTGRIPILSGSVVLTSNSLVPTRVTAVLDAAGVVTDEPDRDRSLESSDFFDVMRFPTWTFASTRITAEGPSAFEMDGRLTIHGVTQSERLAVAIAGTAQHPTYHATAQIDRHAFGMAITRLDPTIGGTVDVTLDITLK